jgi:hypothetical protein
MRAFVKLFFYQKKIKKYINYFSGIFKVTLVPEILSVESSKSQNTKP